MSLTLTRKEAESFLGKNRVNELFGKLPNKLHAVRTPCNQEHSHPSKAEAHRCNGLHVQQRIGLIRNLQVWPKQRLGDISYTADFSYTNLSIQGRPFIVEDVKGQERERFRLVKRLWPKYGIGTLRIMKLIGSTFDCVKEIKGCST